MILEVFSNLNNTVILCCDTLRGQEEQEQKIEKCIDKLERKFSLCVASRIFEFIRNLGEKQKTWHPKSQYLR